MAFDFKKEYKEFYLPKEKPEIVTVPKANYIAVRGKGNPNEVDGDYQKAIGVLYAVAYTLKMSYKTDYRIEGFYVEVQRLADGDVQATDAATDRSSQWSFDAHEVFREAVQSFLRKPIARGLEGFFASEEFQPVDGAFALVSLCDRRVNDRFGGGPDIWTDAVTFNERDGGVVASD